MKVLVTGGAGFIGSEFVRSVSQGKFSKISDMVVIDKLTYSGSLENIDSVSKDSFEFIHGDICDPDVISKAVRGIDAVINFAAESHVDRSIASSLEFVRTNVEGTNNLLTYSIKENVPIFLQVSTDEVYGSIQSGSWNEASPEKPNSPYAASKAAADLLALSFNRTYGLGVRITRCSNNYGPYQFPEKLIPFFITRLSQGKRVPLYGDGKNIRDWLHVSDHCMGIYLTLINGIDGSVYNLGGGCELSNLELTKILISILGKSTEQIDFVEDRLGHDVRYSLNDTKARNELGYLPVKSFEAGIRETVAWYEANPSWWKKRINSSDTKQ